MRFSRLAILALTLPGHGGCHADADAATERAIVAACNDLVDAYAIARDRFDTDAYAATFATDGVLVLPDGTYTGRAAIAARLTAESGKTIAQHFMSTREIVVDDARHARGVVYAMIFVEPLPAGRADDTPVPTSGPVAVGMYHDNYQLTDRGWKISRREFKPTFLWRQP